MRVTRRHAAMSKDFDASAPSPFDELPDEILEQIFKFLDDKSLLCSLLVNRRFCNVIEMSPNIMKKIPPIFDFFWGTEKPKDSKLQRRYSSILIIDGQNTNQKYAMKVLKKISRDVKTVNYISYGGENFYEILSLLPNVETVNVTHHMVIKNFHPLPLPNIETVKINSARFYGSIDLNSLFSLLSNVKHLHLSIFFAFNINEKETEAATSKLKA